MRKLEVLRHVLRGGGELVVVSSGQVYWVLGNVRSAWCVSPGLAEEIISKHAEGKSRINVSDGAFFYDYNGSRVSVGWKTTVMRDMPINSTESKVVFESHGSNVEF